LSSSQGETLVKKLLLVLLALALPLSAQVVAAPAYSVNLNFLTGRSPTALDTVFADQFTTNLQLEGDLVLAPAGGASAYEGGANYNLCGVKTIEKLLMPTSLSCGKFKPSVAFVAGLGRAQVGGLPTQQGLAYMPKLVLGYDPTGAGKYTVIFSGGYGKFAPAVAGESNAGVFFYSGIQFGGGTSAAATQAKIARMKRAEAKKLAKLQAAAKG
jgi:hypothetical protein